MCLLVVMRLVLRGHHPSVCLPVVMLPLLAHFMIFTHAVKLRIPSGQVAMEYAGVNILLKELHTERVSAGARRGWVEVDEADELE